MGTSSEWLGRFTAVDVLVRNELAVGGIDSEGIEAAQTALYAGEGQAFIREAVRKFAIERMKADGNVIDLGDGWLFTVDETIELEVDYQLAPAEIGRLTGLATKDWEYLGTAPTALGQRRVKALIGCLNRNWTEKGVTTLLAKPGCPLRGSGAWVREGFLTTRSNYDGKEPIFFPELASSRWRLVRDGSVYFPDLWFNDGRRWLRNLSRVGPEWYASRRLCLLCE